MYVLEGTGRVLVGDLESVIRVGDYIPFLAGEESAHSTFNDSDEPLVYLCFSTMQEPDIVLYPDSGKLGLFAGAAPGGPPDEQVVKRFGRLADVDYWEGEGEES